MDQCTVIEHDELCEDFLTQEIASDRVGSGETNVVFEVFERGFDIPAKVIKPLKISQRAAPLGDIGNEVFPIAVIKGNADKAEREMKDRGFIVCGDKVKASAALDDSAELPGHTFQRDSASGEEEF